MVNVTIPKDVPANIDGSGNRLQGWVQTDKDVLDLMSKLALRQPAAMAVLTFMVSRLPRGSSGIVISSGALARKVGISERTVKRAVAILKEMRFVHVIKSGNTNAYVINSKVAWQGHRGHRHASFNVEMMVDEREQDQSVDELIIEGDELREVPNITMLYNAEIADDVIDADEPKLTE